MSVHSQVVALAKDLLSRSPKIDELVNNAGNLCTGEPEMASDGVDKNVAVNFVAPLSVDPFEVINTGPESC
jgi:NAD(P)-dependent dehydrogenase (short-subunit alcohol dehydrogenase family)